MPGRRGEEEGEGKGEKRKRLENLVRGGKSEEETERSQRRGRKKGQKCMECLRKGDKKERAAQYCHSVFLQRGPRIFSGNWHQIGAIFVCFGLICVLAESRCER